MRPIYTQKENMIKRLGALEQLSKGDPYKEALHAVLVELAGMACEAATYGPIVFRYEEEPPSKT